MSVLAEKRAPTQLTHACALQCSAPRATEGKDEWSQAGMATGGGRDN